MAECLKRLCLTVVFLVIFLTDLFKCENSRSEFTIGLLGNSLRRGPPVRLYQVGSALTIAIDDIHGSSNLLPNYTLTFVVGNADCNPRDSLDRMIHLVQKHHVDVIFGPTCSASLTVIGHLGAAWNVPMLLYAGRSPELSDKETYPTMLRTASPLAQLSQIVLSICELYNWRKVAVFWADTGPFPYIIDSLKSKLPLHNISMSTFEVMEGHDIVPVLHKATRRTRVLIILTFLSDTLRFMETAYDLGFVQTGEFAFIIQDTRLEKEAMTMDWMFTGDPIIDRKRRASFEYAIHITPLPYYLNDEYSAFLEEVRRRLIEEPFRSNLTSVDQVSTYSGFLYDAGMLYALVTDKMLRHGADPTDGRAFLQWAQTISFQGKTGSVSIDKNGDRKDDYLIYDFQNDSFVRVAYYDGFRSEYVKEQDVLWPGGKAPKDTPDCGFEGEFCVDTIGKTNITSLVVGLTLGVALALTTIAYLYRRRQAETELVAANWRINYEQLEFNKFIKSSMLSVTTAGSEQRSFMLSHGHNQSVALYKSAQVFVRNLAIQSLEWRKRAILLDLKLMKDTRHDNLNVFVGACVEAPNICLVTSFCPRGGLDDVLGNDDIQLDLLFKMSFAVDVAQGLNYLHKSDIKYHGRLKSSNCLVDSRWTIKLADYGLRNLLHGLRASQNVDNYKKYKNLLWTASEHLRAENPLNAGSAKGDIYSFGIVLQEIAVRAAPFYPLDLSPQEIVEKVKNNTSNSTPFRPSLPKDSCPGLMARLMMKCWSELPADRPDIGQVIKDLRQINGGKKINIMDQMVSMLEKYASNLEDIVNERTVQLAEEKRRTETLLFQMLPRSVAEQLKNGLVVKAENFESVTIFFSDIVGFTALSSDSTPMQVVMLLNDLYTMFDDIIGEYDVYKVETIGDAYMVASGLPNRNGIQHAGEIATMSLDLLSATRTFRVRHMPDRRVMLRVGLHSGACVAGVVGLKMPRYCLFGDTVNTASRMESNGLASKVHLSQSTKNLLETLGGYTVIERGQVELKGKGIVTTYWLAGKQGFQKPLPDCEA